MTERRDLIPGVRVRAKVRTMGGWKGCGTITRYCGGDIYDIEKDSGGEATMWRDEFAVLRDQSSPPAPDYSGTNVFLLAPLDISAPK